MDYKNEPCSICEKYMRGVECENRECPVAIEKETVIKLKRQLDSKCDRCIERDKREAYHVFASRLKDGLDDCHIVSDGEYCGYDCSDVAHLIKKLLDEMDGVE